MKLIFLLQRNLWFIDDGNSWSAIKNASEINLALTVLPLEAVDEFDFAEQPLIRGTATVAAEGETAAKITLTAPDGSVFAENTLEIDVTCLVRFEWSDTPEGDGWIKSIARLNVENIRHLSIKTYIPPSDSSDGKNLHVLNQSTGEEKNLFMKRGEENELVVLDGSVTGNHEFVFTCDAEAANDSADVRSLGFVLLDKAIEF